MAVQSRYSKARQAQPVNKYAGADDALAFLRRNAIMLLILVTAAPWLYKYLSKMLLKIEEQEAEHEKERLFAENNDPRVLNSKLDLMLESYDDGHFTNHTREQVKSAARKLAHDLGTVYNDTNSAWAWLDPRGWFENDDEIKNTLIEYMYEFYLLGECYHVITRSRELEADCIKLLDGDTKQELRELGYGSF